MSNTRKPRGLREVLKKRHVRTTYYDLPLVPFDEARDRAQALKLAEQTLQAGEFLQSREDTEEVREAIANAKVAVAAAREALDECFHRIVFAGLPEDEFDALVQLHPPTEQQVAAKMGRAEEPPMWNEDTFIPALLEHCAQQSELSAEEWAAELTDWSRGEKTELKARVLEANIRSFSTALAFA